MSMKRKKEKKKKEKKTIQVILKYASKKYIAPRICQFQLTLTSAEGLGRHNSLQEATYHSVQLQNKTYLTPGFGEIDTSSTVSSKSDICTFLMTTWPLSFLELHSEWFGADFGWSASTPSAD